jgi:hypothetical protein
MGTARTIGTGRWTCEYAADLGFHCALVRVIWWYRSASDGTGTEQTWNSLYGSKYDGPPGIIVSVARVMRPHLHRAIQRFRRAAAIVLVFRERGTLTAGHGSRTMVHAIDCERGGSAA